MYDWPESLHSELGDDLGGEPGNQSRLSEEGEGVCDTEGEEDGKQLCEMSSGYDKSTLTLDVWNNYDLPHSTRIILRCSLLFSLAPHSKHKSAYK